MAEETEVPVVLKLFAQKTSSVNSVLQETKKGFNDLAGDVTAVAKSAAVVSGAFTVALGGIVAAAVNVAGQLEQLQAKLTSTLGSSEAAARSFQKALEFAASTPFDVQGIVQATVQITAFGQSAERILPLAANLAAAFSERVEDVGQILGKAFSGSLEGFESLRNRLGISNILLQKFGAELTKTGGISIGTAASLGKAQDALEKIIKTRFGDATSRQAQTLFGAISNLGDAIQRTGAAFGESLIPFITAASKVLTVVVEKFENLSPATRQFIAGTALAVTGIAALTTGALALVAGLTAGLGGLLAFGTAVKAAFAAASALAVPVAATAVATGGVGAAAAAASVTIRVYSQATGAATASQGIFNAQLLITGRTMFGLLQVIPALTAEVLALRAAATGVGSSLGALALSAGQTAAPLALVSSSVSGLPAVAGTASQSLATFATNTTATGTAATAASRSLLGFLGPASAIALLLGGAALLAINSYRASTAQADAAIVAQTRTLTEARNSFRDYIATIEAVTNSQGKLIQQSGRVSQFAAGLRESLANVTPAEFLANTEKAGISLEKLNKDIEKNQGSSKLLKDRVDDLNTTFALLKGYETGGIVVFTPEEQQIIDRVHESLGLVDLSSQDVAQALGIAENSLQKFLRAGAGMIGLREQFQKTTPLLEEITKESARLQDYLRFATKTDDVGVLNATFNTLEGSIGKAEQALSKLGIPFGNLVDLQNRLLTGSTQEKEAIQKVLDLRDAQDNIDKKLQADEKKRIDERIRLEETGIERNKILKGENKAEEIKIYQELLGIVEKGSQEELSLLTKIANAKQALKRKEVADAKKVAADAKQTLDDLAGSSNTGLEALRATGVATATETSAALKTVLADLDQWATKNDKLIRQNPQLAEDFKKTRAAFQTKFDTSELEKPREKLREALATAKEFGTEAITNVQKQAAASQALGVLQKLQDSGAIRGAAEKAQLQAEINRLKKEELTTSAAVTKEQDAQARLTAGVKRDGLSQEVELLKQQQAIQGKSPFLANQIADKEKQLLAERVQAIRDQEQQEIDAGATKAQAQERTQLRITQLQNEEVSKRISAEQNATSAFSAELQKRQAEEEKFRSQRQGGPNSPLISLGELSATSGFLGNFSLGQFGSQDPAGGRRFGSGQPNQSQLLRVRQTVANDLRQGEALAGRGTGPNALSAQINERQRLEAQAAGGALSGGPGGNISVNINGNAVDKPGIKALTKEAMKELVQDGQLRGGFGA